MPNFMDAGSAFGMPGSKQPDPDAFNHRVRDEEVPLPAFSDEEVDPGGFAVDPENVPWLREAEPPPPEPMQTAGAPRNVTLIDDEQAASEERTLEIERKTRPVMETAKRPVGFPYRRGEGQRYLPDLKAETPNDPSVISAEDWQQAAVSNLQRQPGTFFETGIQVKPGAAGGMGAWPSVTLPGGMVISQGTSAQNLNAQIAANENALRNMSPGALAAVQQNAAAQTSIMRTQWKKVVESPVAEPVAAVAWQAAATDYNNKLLAGIKKTQSMLKARTPSVATALPAAVGETVFSKYGATVLVGGAAVLGLLFWMRSRK